MYACSETTEKTTILFNAYVETVVFSEILQLTLPPNHAKTNYFDKRSSGSRTIATAMLFARILPTLCPYVDLPERFHRSFCKLLSISLMINHSLRQVLQRFGGWTIAATRCCLQQVASRMNKLMTALTLGHVFDVQLPWISTLRICLVAPTKFPSLFQGQVKHVASVRGQSHANK